MCSTMKITYNIIKNFIEKQIYLIIKKLKLELLKKKKIIIVLIFRYNRRHLKNSTNTLHEEKIEIRQ